MDYYQKVVLTLVIDNSIFILKCEKAMWWKKAPFFRILPAFISGIALAWYRTPAPFLLYGLPILGVLLIVWYRISASYHSFMVTWFSGAGMQLIYLSLGSFLCNFRDPAQHKNWYGKIIQPGDTISLQLLQTPVEKTNSFQCRAALIAAWKNNRPRRVEGIVQIYFRKEEGLPVAGSLLVINKGIDPVRNRGNPGEPDLYTYCRLQGISGTVYLEQKNILLRKDEPVSRLNKLLEEGQYFFRSRLKKFIPGRKEYGLAEALLIGYRGDLDKDLSNAYANTGTVHIIAISGMHLALIYGLLMWLFKPVAEKGKLIWLKSILLLLTLWSFSFLCGAQPSILRATISISFILLARILHRRSSTLNALAGSAFLLLCYDPYYLLDPGFQLSFAALTSILIFNQPIRNLFETKNKLIGYVYDLVAVTLAAQILTLPVSIYHFHQFPVYFLFSNLLAVPVSGIILFGEIMLIIASPFPFIGTLLGKGVTFLIQIMNGWIERTANLPGAGINVPVINGWQVLLLFLFILFTSQYLFSRQGRWIWGAVVCILFIASISVKRTLSLHEKHRLIVYDLQEGLQVEYQYAGKAWSLFPSVAVSNPILKRAHVYLQVK